MLARWTRTDVAKFLHVSITTVRRLEGRALHPSIDASGTRLFDPTEVRVVAERRAERPVSKRDDAGEISARVFELFQRGANLRTIVITARVPPRTVRELYAEWLVTLGEGEQARRDEAIEAEDRRERARMERERKQWERQLAASIGQR